MGSISCMAFHEAKNRLIAGSKNGYLCSWNLSDKSLDNIFKQCDNHGVESLQIYKAKNQLLALLHNGPIAIWDLATNNKMQNIDSHTDITAMFLDQDNHRLFIGDRCGKIRIWDFKTNQYSPYFLYNPFFVNITSITLDPKRNCLMVGGSDNAEIGRWDSIFFIRKKSLRRREDYYLPTKALFLDLEENNQLFQSCTNGDIRIWDLNKNTVTQTIPHNSFSITSVIFERLYRRVVLGSESEKIRLFDRESNTDICSFSAPVPTTTSDHLFPEAIISLIQNNNQLIAASTNGQITIWDLYDPDMKKILDTTLRFKKHYALMKAYECWTDFGAIKDTLDLSGNTLLNSGFFALPKALQQVIHKTITVKLTA